MVGRISSPRFVGRVAELEALEELLRHAASGSGGAMLVAGEAGIGKSRLVVELGTRARAAGTSVLVGECVELAERRAERGLFWALRGGGGNFGIVTSFTFRCHEVANVIAGPVFYDLDDAAEVLAWWREFGPAQPDELNGFFAFLSVPPGPPFPEELHLRKVCGIVWCYSGHEDDPDCLREARAFGRPLLDGVQAMPLPALQSAFDGIYPPGDQWYWRGDFVSELPDEAIERHVEHGAAMPTWKSTMHLYPVDGAASRVDTDATPWAYRDAKWAEVIVGVDPDPANAAAIRQWCVDYWEATHPYSMGGSQREELEQTPGRPSRSGGPSEESGPRYRASRRNNPGLSRLGQCLPLGALELLIGE